MGISSSNPLALEWRTDEINPFFNKEQQRKTAGQNAIQQRRTNYSDLPDELKLMIIDFVNCTPLTVWILFNNHLDETRVWRPLPSMLHVDFFSRQRTLKTRPLRFRSSKDLGPAAVPFDVDMDTLYMSCETFRLMGYPSLPGRGCPVWATPEGAHRLIFRALRGISDFDLGSVKVLQLDLVMLHYLTSMGLMHFFRKFRGLRVLKLACSHATEGQCVCFREKMREEECKKLTAEGGDSVEVLREDLPGSAYQWLPCYAPSVAEDVQQCLIQLQERGCIAIGPKMFFIIPQLLLCMEYKNHALAWVKWKDSSHI